MFSPFERWVAGRYLRARRQEGFISVIAWFSLIGIALGVATLIIVLSVMNGFRSELLGRIMGIGGHAIVHAMTPGEGLRDFDSLAGDLLKIDGVTGVVPSIDGQVMASANGRARGAMVRGMRPDDLRARDLVADNITVGSLDGFKSDGRRIGVVVGGKLANKLGLRVGDEITLTSPEGRATPVGTALRSRAYPIAAMFDVGMIEYDTSLVFMPLDHAQRYFMLPDMVNEIELFVEDPETVARLGPAILDATAGRGRIFTWQQANSQFFTALQVERNVMFLILTLIILVAAFNIISSLIMMVHDKGKGIAILRTVGATRGMIMRIFFLTGASVGAIGTFAGFVLGLAFCANIERLQHWLEGLTGTELFAPEIYFLSNLPAKIDPTEVTMVVLMGLGLSLLATLYPSWRAARLDPVEALRYE